MESSIDERINQGITHAEEEDGWLHLFAQLDGIEKEANDFIPLNTLFERKPKTIF